MKSEYFKIKKLPDSSGVYFFKKGKQILYVGKATSLRDRVRSYMSKGIFDIRGPLIEKMTEEADKIDWVKTESVLEALILESKLIKKHQPYYNTKEKDNKSFNYVCITKESLSKVMIVRERNIKRRVFNKIYGPYTSGSQLLEALKIIRKIFPFLDEKSKNYIEFYKQINLIPDLENRKMYLENIKNIKLFFEGKKKKILKNLEKNMKEYAKRHEFEKAGEVKRQIFALKHINDVALLKNNYNSSTHGQNVLERTFGSRDGDGQRKFSTENFRGESGNILVERVRIEAYDIAHLGGKNMVGVMTVIENGEVEKSEYKKFSARGGSAFGGKTVLGNSKSNDIAALKEILERRLAHKEWNYPNLIVVDGGVAQLHAAMSVLKKSSVKIPVVSVVKDDRHKPKDIMGDKICAVKYKKEILLANSEAHRFAIAYHKNMRNKNFLK